MADAREIELFNNEISVRKYGCKNNSCKKPYWIETPRVNIFIQVTNKCNANCNFCIYHNNDCIPKFNVSKLEYILKEISNRKDIDIGKLNYTGGEPTLDMVLLNEIIDISKNSIDLLRKPEITLNTNGFKLDEILKYQDFLDSIGLSHHHYNDSENFDIFGTNKVATADMISNFLKNLKEKEKLQLRCNLIKGYIDSYNEIIKYMDKAIELGANNCGFVTLMPNNQFCLGHQIDFSSLVKINKDLIKVNSWNRLNEDNLEEVYCECANYVYSNKNGEFCKFYSRLFCRNDNNDGILVYDGQNLRHGFGGKILY